MIEQQIHAIRYSAALTEMDHMSCVRLSGEDAFDLLDHICPAELYLRDTQILHTLFLDERALPVADVYVCRNDEEFILIAEGLTGHGLKDYIFSHNPKKYRVEIEDLCESHQIFSLNGPYSWEVLAELVGPEVVGLPYLTFCHFDDLICFRTGKTGEYGYDLLIPFEKSKTVWDRLLDTAKDTDLIISDLTALDQCALENFFFNIRREGQAGVTPLELQLQWRVSYRKEYIGSMALAERKKIGPLVRLTCLLADGSLQVGDEIKNTDKTIGKLVNTGYSHICRQHMALGLIETAYAHSGIIKYTAGDSDTSVLTVSPPIINNRSLYVSPQIHRYQTRDQFEFPPLAKYLVNAHE